MSSDVTGARQGAADGETSGRGTAPIRWRGRAPAAAPAAAAADLLPPISWAQLEEVLSAMAVTTDQALMVRHLLAGARRDAPRLPVEETIRDILCIGAAVAPVEPIARPAA
ncbi:hypothetical protein [Brevundimonas sp.]|uniref:hypothetical protein n=1 Tax=Brevundimonas sp. TaxID=1871086 RepID=UPI0035B3DEC0